MALGDGIRRNIATVSQAERDLLRDAFLKLNESGHLYPDGVSKWFKQDQIHQATHVHGGPAFVPWHRELINRLEVLLRQVDPRLSLHYWDWTTDPRSSSNGAGGMVNLMSSTFMGGPSGAVGAPFGGKLDNNNVFAGSREQTNNPADPPQVIDRSVDPGAPSVDSDANIVSTGNSSPQAAQWAAFRTHLEDEHDDIHGYIGGDISALHTAFEDPFVYLLHSNVDRLWAAWQRASGEAWRLDPDQVYGHESTHIRITENLAPWDGSSNLRPWASPDNRQLSKSSRHPSVVAPPLYDDASAEGHFVVVWEDDADGNGLYQIHAAGFFADGTKHLWDFTVNSAAAGQQLKPVVSMADNGNFVVVWEDDKDGNGYYQIFARAFTRSGTEVFRDLTVNSAGAGQQLKPQVATASDGSFVVVWEDDKDDNGFYQIFARGFNADGSQKFADKTVNSVGAGQQLKPQIAMAPNGDFVVVWEDDKDDNGFYQILARGFNADGSQKFADKTINSAGAGQQLKPQVSMASDGSFVVVWEDDKDGNGFYQIFARGFNANGSQKFADKTVNSAGAGQQLKPQVSMASDGSFVVVWEDDKDGNGFYQIFARGFNANGSQKFADKTVNSAGAGQQLKPQISMAKNGDFVVVWEDDKNENGLYQIYARGFNANGSQKFADKTVNDRGAGQQLKPVVAM